MNLLKNTKKNSFKSVFKLFACIYNEYDEKNTSTM